jgi:hypothetical protein
MYALLHYLRVRSCHEALSRTAAAAEDARWRCSLRHAGVIGSALALSAATLMSERIQVAGSTRRHDDIWVISHTQTKGPVVGLVPTTVPTTQLMHWERGKPPSLDPQVCSNCHSLRPENFVGNAKISARLKGKCVSGKRCQSASTEPLSLMHLRARHRQWA